MFTEKKAISCVFHTEAFECIITIMNQSNKQHVRVMIIDDDEIDRMSYVRALNSSSTFQYHIYEAALGNLGLKQCMQIKPNCLILDYNIPELNGIEILRELNQAGYTQQIAIIFLTGQGDEDIAVQAIENGAFDYIKKSDLSTERLNLSVKLALEKKKLQDALEKKNEQLKRLAYYDHLTGLLNRTSFEESLKRMLASAKRYQKILALLFIDLDHFKMINDSYGHQIGDGVLKHVASVISSCIRKSDIATRLGGDEFAIALTDIQNQHDGGNVAQKIQIGRAHV